MKCNRFWAGMVLVVSMLASDTWGQETIAEAPSRGRTPLRSAQTNLIYKRKWALIIGVNYEGRTLTDEQDQVALPELTNAVRDAQSLAALLQSHYGYEKETVFLLTEQEAKDETIRDMLGKLCDPELVEPDHSVLVFFAGHGVRIDGDRDERAAIYPYDVQLSSGKPRSRYIELHKHVFDKLRSCPARHKLLILDSCYSGEVFNLGFQPRSETDDRGDESLFDQSCIQAMASCRASQVASDGDGEHSPFTQALIDGLQRLPARDRGTRLWANRLFAYMRPRVRQNTGQNPDCRNLEGDGEFYFIPDDKADFNDFLNKVADFRLLQATVASEQGNWWFDEMPWFIPSLREKILERDPPQRASLYASTIDRSNLLKLAKDTAREYERWEGPASGVELDELRNRHLQQLLNADKKRAELKTELEAIEADLLAEAVRPELEAADVHLLAVVQHALNREEAPETYEEAIEAYERAEKTEEGRAGASKALHALCLADYGEYLFDKQLATDAAERFQQAGVLFDIDPAATDAEATLPKPRPSGEDADPESHDRKGRMRQFSDAPPAFRIFILCREADAWLRVNRWALANRRLQDARDAAEEFDTQHFLAAYVHSRRAWSEMIQWKIADAKGSFLRSNAILKELINSNRKMDGESAPAKVPADERPSLAAATQGAKQPCAVADESCFVLDDVFRNSSQYHTKVAYFHNLHGLAMAERFQGDSLGAARRYRWLLSEIETSLSHLRISVDRGDDTAESTLLERFTNSQERLGDCHLFGAPEMRDLKEAYDDYRRALNRIHLLGVPSEERDRRRAVLLYKQALALSLPSPIQDVQLAKIMCSEADRIYQSQTSGKTNGLFRGLGELTAPVLSVIDGGVTTGENASHEVQTPIEVLRQALLAFRDEIGQNPHRDQLELCLFAARTLVEHGCAEAPFHWNEDADLLLSFCRLALDPYRSDAEMPAVGFFGESRAYLRPYYDAAMRCKLANSPKHVKDLLEIQWEATRGTYFVKPEQATPTLAIYRLDEECYLFLDLPGREGVSKFVSLASVYEARTIEEACQYENKRLALPAEIARDLNDWRAAFEEKTFVPRISCVWEDPVRGMVAPKSSLSTLAMTNKPTVPHYFPFRLPEAFEPSLSPLDQAASPEAELSR